MSEKTAQPISEQAPPQEPSGSSFFRHEIALDNIPLAVAEVKRLAGGFGHEQLIFKTDKPGILIMLVPKHSKDSDSSPNEAVLGQLNPDA